MTWLVFTVHAFINSELVPKLGVGCIENKVAFLAYEGDKKLL